MKTLNEQYQLIKEGKGHKGVFLNEAKRQFPQYIRNAATFDETTTILKQRGIINENIVGLAPINSISPKKESYESAFEAFLAEAKKKDEDEKVKAEEKKVSKPVEEDLSKIFDHADKKNIDNMIFDQVMKGYYTEMKDPKNADKTMEELKAIVLKNLEKDPIFYTKDGQFGVKGVGYETEVPGLGTPKEAKGKFKSSGYGDLKEGIGKNYPDEISGEYEGSTQKFQGVDLYDFLKDMLELSNSENDFVNKVAYGITDMTSPLSKTDQEKLRTWYKRNSMDLGENLDKFKSDVKKGFTTSSTPKPSDEDIKAKLKQKREEELKRRKEAGESLEEIKLREVIREIINAELEEVTGGGNYGILTINPSGGGGGRRFIPDMIPFPVNIRKRFGDHMVYNPANETFYISQILYNNLVKGYADQPAIKKLIMDIPMMVKQLLNKTENYGQPTELPKQFKSYMPFVAPVSKAKEDKFNKAGDKQYWAEGDFLFPNLNKEKYASGGDDLQEQLIRTFIRESVEKELAQINKEAELETLASKLEKIEAAIQKRQSQLSKLDEDEDMKNLTDKKKVKGIEKEIKTLEKAKSKVEKMMGKSKTKKKEVIDEDSIEEVELNELDPKGMEDAKTASDELVKNFKDLEATAKKIELEETDDAPEDVKQIIDKAEMLYDELGTLEDVLDQIPSEYKDVVEKHLTLAYGL